MDSIRWEAKHPPLMQRQLAVFTAGLLALSAGSLLAGKDSDLGKAFGKPSQIDVIAGGALGKRWVVAKGEWKAVDGTIRGRELGADKHAAVLTFAEPNTDSAIQFSFKLDGTKGFHLSYNKSRGHLFRVLVAETGVTISLDKDKKDKKSRPQRLGAAKGWFKQGEWYTMLVVVEGENVSVQTDNGVQVTGSHPTIRQKKPNYRFVMRGESLLLDDLKIWQLK